MITGIHALLYTSEAGEVRAFFRDVLEWPSVDAGHGWLIFAAPPTELGVHPSETSTEHELYLMCDDVHATIAALAKKGVACPPVQTERWGLRTAIPLPSGSALGLYQPTHPTALGMI